MAEDSIPPLEGPLELPEDNTPPKPPKNRKKLLVIFLVVLVLAGVGFGVWKLILNKKPASQTASNSQNTAPAANSSQSGTDDIPDAKPTEAYEKGFLGLELTYPKGWTVTDTSDNGVRIESPEFSYQTLDKGKVTGYFRIYIRKGARASDAKYIGRGVAIKPSEKLAYKDPAPDQRKDTLVSSFGLDETDNFAYFMVAGNFDLKVGDTLGPTYGKEPETFIIAGGYSSKDLTDDMATNKVGTAEYDQTNAHKQALAILETLQLH